MWFNYQNIEYGKNGDITKQKTVSCSKFEINIDSSELSSCGHGNENIILQYTFINSSNNKVFDCSLMSSKKYNFISLSSLNDNRSSISNDISGNITNSEQNNYRNIILRNLAYN